MHDRYQVVAAPPFSPPGMAATILAPLAAALNRVGTPVGDALEALAPDMVEVAFNSISPKDRQDLLHSLGIRLAAPRRASKALCRDLHTRMKRELAQNGCTCSARALTSRVRDDLVVALYPTGFESTAADPVERWGTVLVRLAVFTWFEASAADARIFVWAAEQDWLGLGTGHKELDAIRDAAAAVVEATPDFRMGGHDSPEADAEVSPEQDELSDHTVTVAEATLGQGTMREQPDELDPSDASTVDMYAACQALELSLETAREAARRIAQALDDGCPPAEDDLHVLTGLPPAFTRLQGALAEAGLGPVACRLDEMSQAVAAYRVESDRDRVAREALHLLLAVSCGADGATAVALGVAHERAQQLLDSSSWTESEQEQAEALKALVEIVEIREQPDVFAQIMARQQRVSQILPECLAAAMMFPQLSIPERNGSGASPIKATHREGAVAPARTIASVRAPQLEQELLASAVGTESSGSRPEDQFGPAAGADPGPSGSLVVVPGLEADPEPSEALIAQPHDRKSASHRWDEPDLVESALCRLVAEGRFGLAGHLSQAAGHPDAEAVVFRLAAASAALHSMSAAGTRFFGDVLQQLDALDASAADGTEALLLATLVRGALVTGESAVGAQLRALAPRLPSGLADAAIAVADRALNGALLIAPPMAVITDVSESESRLREITQSCRDLMKPPRLRYNRATHIAKRWLAAEGILGSLLQGIVDNEHGTGTAEREAVSRLSRLSEVHSEIDRADKELRGPSGRPLQGPGRQDLVHMVERVTDCWKSWYHLSEGLNRGSAVDNDWAVQEISAMRRTLLSSHMQVVAELEAMSRRANPMMAASSWSARGLLTDLFHELEHGVTGEHGGEWQETEADSRQVADVELLKIPLPAGVQPTVSDLVAAVDQSWDEALTRAELRDAFDTAYEILDLAERGALPGPKGMPFEPARRERIREAEGRRRTELSGRHGELVAALRRAQADGALTDDQDVSLQELLDQADPVAENGTRELSLIRRTLDQVSKFLPLYRREAADRLRARLEELPDVTDDERAQVLRHLDTDGLATAADLVYFLELGEPVPEITSSESHLTDFFPTVPDGLPDGITASLVECVRNRETHRSLSALDYSGLSADEARRAATALQSWHGLAVTKKRLDVNVREDLLPALQLLGYEARRARPRHDLPRSNEYQFADVSEIEINGRAWAPAFGTKILERSGRLRVLMLWGRPSAQLLLSRVEQEPSGESLLVAYFGTLDSRARAALAAASVGGAPLMVVDDAALAYLAARGNRQVSATNALLLPFSGVNPYIREKRGRIGREMFYGRDAERKKILDPDGTQIIFGGRGLGKSALLNDAGDRFVEQQPAHHRKLYLNLDHHNIGKGAALGPETIWRVLERELTDQDVLVRPRRREQENDPYERVRAGVTEWLSDDAQRRLLVLMDECDRFFESDVPHCTETRRLRGLCENSQGRVKVVFAGLHSVQRFTRLARNGPFSHLAQTPTVVGPLAPQYAADLLVLPTRALGFEFADVDLVNRVLGYCSYQPFLLQMFGSRLVEVMQRKRARGGRDGLPLSIQPADVEAVESDPSLRADITAAFKDTLTLDDRYNVIANVLARHARDNGLETRMSDAELRDECASWWPDGFNKLDSEGFRAYLQEMVGLGVLAPNHDGRGWHLRGPNALRMIGTAQEVENRLLSADAECRLEQVAVLEGCPQLSEKRPAPLTVTQINDILGEHANQVRVVLGTSATGIGSVEETLRDVAGRFAGWSLPAIGRLQVFRQELTNGRPGERRAVISDLFRLDASEAACRESLESAQISLPNRPGVTRSVVLVLGPGQLPLWRELMAAPDTVAFAKVVLRRHDRHSLRSWTQNSDLYKTEKRLTGLLEVTGGWPVLLDRAVILHADSQSEEGTLLSLKKELQQKDNAAKLVDATGLTVDPLVATAFRAIVAEFGTGWTDEGDVLAAAELAGMNEQEAYWALACLEVLQAVERDGVLLRAENVLTDCWFRI